MQKKILLGFTMCAMLATLLSGCGKSEASGNKNLVPENQIDENQVQAEASDEVDEETVEEEFSEEPEAKEVTIETRKVKLTISNVSGIAFGDFTYTNPISGQEVNAGNLLDNKAYYYDLDWPVVVEEIHWTIYDTDMNEYLSSTSEMSDAENEIIIMINGDGENVTSVDISYN